MKRRRLKLGTLHLPWAENAYIPLDPNRLKEYALNPEHKEGGASKAKWFRAALDMGPEDWECLHDQILERVPFCWVCDYTFDDKWPHGAEFGVQIPIDGRNGRTCEAHTGWLIPYRDDSPRPKLSTAGPPRYRES